MSLTNRIFAAYCFLGVFSLSMQCSDVPMGQPFDSSSLTHELDKASSTTPTPGSPSGTSAELNGITPNVTPGITPGKTTPVHGIGDIFLPPAERSPSMGPKPIDGETPSKEKIGVSGSSSPLQSSLTSCDNAPPTSQTPTQVIVDISPGEETSKEGLETPFFKTLEGNHAMMATLAAVAHEAYGSTVNPKDVMSPKKWLEEKYTMKQNGNYIIVSPTDPKDKKVFIAFPGTKFSNIPVSIGSCTEWDDTQFDKTGQAMLPWYLSFIKKPYTYFRNLAFASTFCCFTSMFYLWSGKQDILCSGSLSAISLTISMLMYLNLVPLVASRYYARHIINLFHEIEPVYAEERKNGNQVYFVGHSLGGHIAELMAYFFPESKAVSFSAPGGGCMRSLSFAGQLIAMHGKQFSHDLTSWKKRIMRCVMEGDPIHDVLKHKYDNNGVYTAVIPSTSETSQGYDISAHRIYHLYAYYILLSARNRSA
ncbi:MAG: hypothetical protein HEEMFOPI_00050 [Holosporales bacterium]